MFVVNVTTPIQKFTKFTGRFGFSEDDRHLVALVNYPAGSVGIELLANMQRMDDFDIKFLLCTPMEFLQQILLVGLLKPDKVSKTILNLIVLLNWKSLFNILKLKNARSLSHEDEEIFTLMLIPPGF